MARRLESNGQINQAVQFKRKNMLAHMEITDDDLDLILADQLLESWYQKTQTYKIKLGYQRIAPYCKQFRSSRQFDDASSVTDKTTTDEQFIRIDLCVDKLDIHARAAIQIEMKNREVRKKVWKSEFACSYAQALECIFSIMRDKGLFD